MRRLLGAIVLALAITGPSVHAQGLSYSKFHSDITIHQDASIKVVETIDVDFSTAHHGIFRNIPYSFTTLDGGQASIPIHIDTITQDGQPAQYTVTTDSTNVTAKIGDANHTITGQHEYVISYTAEAAINFFSDHDELYWNVTGTTWDEPLTNVSATVQFTNAVTDAKSKLPLINQTACYTGTTGSTAQNCTHTANDSLATFTSQDFLTVVVGWPTGFVTKPANFDTLRAAGSQAPAKPIPGFHGPLLTVNILAPLVSLVAMLYLWWTRGRDPGKHRTVIAQYDPPDDLRPAELSSVMHERASAKSLPATLVDLAVRGYIKIIETEKAGLLGLGHKTDYALQSLKAPDEQVRDYEKDLLEVLFEEHIFPAGDNQISISDLKQRHYMTDPFAPIFRQVTQQVVSAGYFQGNPSTVRGLWAFGGVLVAGLGILLAYWGIGLYGLIPAGLMVMIFSGAMPRRTTKGVEAAWVGHGFQLFLEKAEQYRLKWQEREGIFEKFLPYAMVFGVADKWSKALAPMVTSQPSWYQGQHGSAFNTIVFWSAMSNFSGSVSVSTVSAAASGSSGFGGGGFSGGGGGGGGGGGW